MEWQDWLEKTEPTGLTDRQKELAKEIADGDNEDHKNLFAKKLEPKEASWESWLDKTMTYRKTRGNIEMKYPTEGEEVWDSKQQKRVKEDKTPKRTNKLTSWESFLDKNNGIETDHKKENKKEWNGKFSSSTIRDDAENDDDKAVSEEESLEELTDGKLEEIEKLKSWEVFLEKNQYPQDNIPEKKDEDGDPEINYETGTKLQTSGETGQATLTDEKHRDKENENTSNNLTERFSRGNLRGKKIGAGRIGYNTAGASGGNITGQDALGRGGKTFGAEQFSHNSGDSPRPNADGTRTTIDGLRQQIARINEHENKKELSATGQPATAHQKEVADIEQVGKAWESWLTKYVETDSDKELSIEIDTARQTGLKKIPRRRTKPESGVDAKEGEISLINAEKWKSWLEKMQGAGDARFGNQHLTGMEQHPVSDDDSLELSPETEENNEKQDKKEDKEDKNNKPYKALR